MNIIITGRHIEVTPPIKEHIYEKFKKIERHASEINKIKVILVVENKHSHNPDHKAEATLQTSRGLIVAHSTTKDMYHSIEKLAKKMDRQIRDQKESAEASGEHIAYS